MTMTQRRQLLAGACALLATCGPLAAHAERADRTMRIEITAADARANQADRTAEFSGDVLVSQGTLEIHADRVQMRMGSNGERLGFAFGKAGAPVRFRQHGDRPDEWNEGQADRVEYDSLANEVRLIGAASMRNLNGAAVMQSVYSDAITYDTARDTISSTRVEQRPAAGAPPPRVKIVFEPLGLPASGAAGSAPAR
jgi:lipopolysaccharide export system protein LptA